ncbi:hypothetical protein ACIP25_11530 [Streptomyces massasporeus]|uniref:hypothetical protein n=1 Tax=Streptomyces massasporeus TaxID=67324 RepID=UPI00380491E4
MTSTTDSPTPSFPITLLVPVAEALESSDPQVRAEVFARLAEEALELAKQSTSTDQFWFWGHLHEDFHAEAVALLAPPKPKRRWFR